MTQETLETNEYFQIRLEKLENIKKLGHDIYPSSFKKDSYAADLTNKYKDLAAGEKTEDEVRIAGRIMAIRNDGMFIDLQDESGRIQVFSHKNQLDENQLSLIKLLDLGDIIGVTGKMRCTPRGELTVDSYHVTFLTKALLTLPEKYHGLTDVETRYRNRYVDLIINENSRDVLRKRSEIISGIRSHLTDEGYLEVETPMLHPIAGGAIAKPFTTHHNSLDITLFLRIAPELYLKKLIVGGLSEKIFEINRCFRNEGISTRHNPEFTSIEIYRAYVDYEAMIDLTEEIINKLVMKTNGKMIVKFGEKELDFTGPWPRKSMASLVKDATGIDFMKMSSDKEAIDAADKLGVKIQKTFGWGKILEEIFAQKVEPNLSNPIHITELPTEISPLAKVSKHDPRITERFETYINGWEVANGFSELNDPIDQFERFKHQASLKEQGDEEAFDIDHDFIRSLEFAMPPTGGLGIGIDRLVMLLTDSQSIREVIAFPTLRPKS
jgi:lysyl-tRNA synthetase class 2